MKNSACVGCPFSDAKMEGYNIRGKGNEDAEIAVIGEGPGYVEAALHEPWRGEAGAIANFFLLEAGLIKLNGKKWNNKYRYKNLYFDNVTKCVPYTVSEGGEANISVEVLKRCRPLFASKMKQVKPKYVLCFGSSAYRSITTKYSANITDVKGFWEYVPEFDFWIMPTLHPAAVLRNWDYTSEVWEDIKEFRDGIKHGIPEYKLGKYKVLRDLSEIKKRLAACKDKPLTAIDFETTNTKFWSPKECILGMSFSYLEKTGLYIPFVGQHRKPIWSKREDFLLRKEVRDFLKSNIPKAGQNIKYDVNFSKKEFHTEINGIVHDTMQYHHLIDEGTPANLTYLTLYYKLHMPKYEDSIEKYFTKNQKNRDYSIVPTDVLGKYACADSDATLRIANKQRGKEFKTPIRQRLYETVSVPLARQIIEIEWEGSLIDIKRIHELEKQYQQKIDSKGQILANAIGSKTFNPRSSKDVSTLFFDKLQLPVVRRTKKGNSSTDRRSREIWKRMVKSNKKVLTILNTLDEVNKMGKMKSTYLTGFAKVADSNGKVHSNIMSTGTVTGRPASTSPNILNIPRDETFRSLFIAGPGRKIIAADYSQIEYKLLALLANETKLLKRFQSDPTFDIHTYQSATFRRIKESLVKKEWRSYDKAITFGINYGRSAKSIADEYNWKKEDVQAKMDMYFQTHPNIAKFRKLSVLHAHRHFFVSNRNGRCRNFPGLAWLYSAPMTESLEIIQYLNDTSEDRYYGNNFRKLVGGIERQAINFPIQSFAHDLLVEACARILKRRSELKLDFYLFLEVYDALLFNCADKDVSAVKKIVEREMPAVVRNDYGAELRFTADIQVGDCWK